MSSAQLSRFPRRQTIRLPRPEQCGPDLAFDLGGEWVYAGGNSSGSDDGDQWDLRPIYRSLAAAYGWTYAQIDQHTLAEARELFEGWDEHPPTNILVKALLDGFGGGKNTKPDPDLKLPPHIQDTLQRSAVAAINAKADPKWLPVTRGRDPGLPGVAPIFDLDELREKNAERLRQRAQKGVEGVGKSA